MVFLGIFMMPFYYGSKAHSVPEYLRLRYDEKTRAFNAGTFAVMTIFSSGISLYALAKLLESLLHWNFNASIAISAAVVLVYITLGGLTSAIYNEVLQFFMIVFGFAPLAWIGLRDAGGWTALKARLAVVATNHHPPFPAGTYTQSWQHMGHAASNPMGVEWFGLAMGLGFVLSFGYWCTDFLVVQRAMAANSMSAARRTPLIAAFPKMLFPFLVILPGMVALGLMQDKHGGFALPTDANGTPEYNMVIPVMLGHYLPSGLLGLGFTALAAAFMSGMAGNVTAFNTVWTYDLYQSYIAPGKSDKHYLLMGRLATIVGVLVSVGAAYLASKFNNIMNLLQLVFAFVNAPLFATFLLGMFWRRATGHGAFWGLMSGTALAAIHHGITLPEGNDPGVKGGWLGMVVHHYPSEMAQNFWTAIFAWTGCFLITIAISLATKKNRTDAELKGLVYSLTPKPVPVNEPWYQQPLVLGGAVLAATLALNLIFA
jgi:SSS family solute:Na+ symporter